MQKTCLVRRAGAVGLVVTAAATVPASAQDEGGRRLSGVVSQSVEAGSNLAFRPGESDLGARSVTTLGLGFLTETRTQSFALDATVIARSKVIGDEDSTADDLRVLPTVELTYGIEGPRTRLGLEGYYRLDAVDEDTEAQEYLVAGTISRQLTRGLSANARLGYRVDGAENDGVLDDTASYFFTLGTDYAGQLWQVGASAGVRIFEDEVRPTGEVHFSREMPRGEIGGFVGVSSSRDADLAVVGGLEVDYALNRTNRLNGSLDQSISVSDEGEDQLRTTARLAYVRDLTSRSSAQLGASVSLRNGLGDSGIDNLPGAGLDLGYSYELTERADLNLGYEYRFEEEAAGPSSQSHLISVGITLPFDL
ncbi:hypothetical protein GE300_19345 [Rhodobacteraceae bacterium 2CG4]|uniref:Outer membrane beta-barrel protein n=1 Tax=Halovulum marinum TaxID=2662447 RepID=A0A6L5Z586_9RHOB|nr:hypothetical protein [Halovulum marinum]MSU91738.1 hypothetical protein [Halovulum marinum]